jgi:hypothetical protein
MAGRNQAATKALNRIGDETGSEGMSIAICSWIDTVSARLRQLGMPEANGMPVRPMWINDETEAVADADGVPPAVRWAGQLAAARAAKDRQTWEALIMALPEDPSEAGQHIWALLSGAALTLRSLPLPRSAGAS